jgi:hypothetical protein
MTLDNENVASATMREEVFGVVQPLDSAGTYRKAA